MKMKISLRYYKSLTRDITTRRKLLSIILFGISTCVENKFGPTDTQSCKKSNAKCCIIDFHTHFDLY